MPNYFSGTNCLARGSAYLKPAPEGEPLGQAEFMTATLWIGGTEVETWTNPNPGENADFNVALDVWFDSTHFQHGPPVKVEFQATDNYGRTYPLTGANSNGRAEGEAVVRNKAVIFGRDDLEGTPLNHDLSGYVFGDSSWNGVPTAITKLTAMNWLTWQHKIRGWDSDYFLTQVGLAQLVYLNTHGATGRFWSDKNDYNKYYPTDPPTSHPDWTADEQFIDGTTHLPASGYYGALPYREATHGTGLPPFNTGIAPISFVFIDGCKAGLNGSDHVIGFLHPQQNTYSGGQTVNQAFVSFLVDTDAYMTETIVTELFGHLQQGWTAAWARDHAYDFYKGHLNDPGTQFGWMSIHGDSRTKTHGVYTGSNEKVAVTAWYR